MFNFNKILDTAAQFVQDSNGNHNAAPTGGASASVSMISMSPINAPQDHKKSRRVCMERPSQMDVKISPITKTRSSNAVSFFHYEMLSDPVIVYTRPSPPQLLNPSPTTPLGREGMLWGLCIINTIY
jgi:hypothetical protein